MPTSTELITVAPQRASFRTPRRKDQRNRVWIWIFLAPLVVLFGLYTVWPALSSLYYATLDWSTLGGEQQFVGFANFERALQDDLFWNSLGVTLLIILVTVPIRVFLSLLLAILLNNPRLPFARVFRTAFFLPAVATTAIIGIVMGFILDPAAGPVNSFLGAFGIGPIDFLGSSASALPTVMVVHMWKWLGITLMYWLAALQTVPSELLEAAQMDGAGAVRRFWSVTLPLLRPFLLIITLLTIIETMQIFDLVQTMTGGGPYFSTLVTEVYVYQQAFTAARPQLGYASAIGVLFGVATFIIVGLYGLMVAAGKLKGRNRG